MGADYNTDGRKEAMEAREQGYIYGSDVKKSATGPYTLKDYLELPDERRVEMIDGYFYDMSAPGNAHQIIDLALGRILSDFVHSNRGQCVTLAAPSDVQLGGADDDKTIVQPDVMVVCDRSKITGPRIVGAPDLVIEILSPSTRKKDMGLKRRKYEDAGVCECWFVDPDKRYVLVYVFGEDPDVTIYGFDAKIPVYIFDGELEIDFNDIWEDVRFLYEREK